MKLECWFDGAAFPNPGGRGGYGSIGKVNGQLLYSCYGYLGHGPQISNNVAEYAACIVTMRKLLQLQSADIDISKAIIYGDSDLVIRQMSGRGKASNGLYVPYYLLARKYRDRLPTIQFRWIPREDNTEADALSQLGLNDKVVRPVLTYDPFDSVSKDERVPDFASTLRDSASNAVADPTSEFSLT